MSYIRPLLTCIFFAIALPGCKKAEAPAPSEPSSSVAAPASTMPTPDAQMPAAPPDAAASSGGNANGPTQASPKELSKKEESSAMPLSGQTNNHSTPETTGEKK